MRIGIVGLGRMGGNMCRRLMKAGHRCVVFDADESIVSLDTGALAPLRGVARVDRSTSGATPSGSRP